MTKNHLSIDDIIKKTKNQEEQISMADISDHAKNNLGKSLISDIAKTPEEIQEYIKENKEMLYRMVRFAKSKGLKIRAYIPPQGQEGTFACSLGEAGMQYFDAYIRGKIAFEDIPSKYFRPKYIEYFQKRLETKTKKLIGPIVDHELQHAESSDYADIIKTTRREYENDLPGGSANRFFNGANEDPYMGNLQSSKGYGKHQGVLDLYKHFYPQENQPKDLSHKYKMAQLTAKIQFLRLSRLFPGEFSEDIKVDEDVQSHIDSIMPMFDELISPNSSNADRIARKNEVFYPIILDLVAKDIQRKEIEKKYQEMMNKQKQEQQEQQEQEQKLEQQGENNNNQNNNSDQQSQSSEEGEQSADGQSNEKQQQNNQQSGESSQENLDSNSSKGENPDQQPQQGPLSPGEIQDSIDQMSPEDRQKLNEEAKKELENENIKELKKNMPGIPQPLKGDNDLQNQPSYPKEQEDRQLTSEEQKQQEQMDKFFESVEQRMDDEETQKQLQQKAKETQKDLKDLKDLQQAQKKLDQLKKEAQKIKTKDVQEETQKQIDQQQKQLDQAKQNYLSKLQKQGFTPSEEKYYKEYISIEKSMNSQVDGFLRDLERFIPKIKEYSFGGYHNTGRVKDVVRAGIKLRQKHYGELYHKKEESESLKINLGICLSIDVSQSMDDKMNEVKQLTVFLGLLCQKREIPFSINAFGKNFHQIKSVKDTYDRQKGEIMRLAKKSERSTNISLAVLDNLKTIKQQERENPDITFLPIFITDGGANRGLMGEDLSAQTRKFKGLELIFGLALDQDEKSEIQQNFPRSKPIFLDDSKQMLTKGKQELIKYFQRHKDKIFKK